MAKFKVNSKTIVRELLHTGLYTDCEVYKDRGIKIIAVKDGKIQRSGSYEDFIDLNTQKALDDFIKRSIRDLGEYGSN